MSSGAGEIMDEDVEENAGMIPAPLPCALAIDPGRAKCGVAVARQDGQTLFKAIVPLEDLTRCVQEQIAAHHPIVVLCGDGTGSKPVLHSLLSAALGVPIQSVDEAHTSEAARLRFVRENKPPLGQRLLPLALRTPWQPYDDYVALLLAERYWSLVTAPP